MTRSRALSTAPASTRNRLGDEASAPAPVPFHSASVSFRFRFKRQMFFAADVAAVIF
ncbi:MAG: hypothetical protein E7I13_05040 [Negativicoccus succinicivorans]|nr:hypothetical protein [Negativicoccus succinicivorans]